MKIRVLMLGIVLLNAINLKAQKLIKEVSIEYNTSLTNYNGQYHLCECDFRYQGIQPNKFVAITNVKVDMMFTKLLGVQFGVQSYKLQYDNDQFIVEYSTGGHETIVTKDYDFGISVKKTYLEMPIYLKVEQGVTKDLSLSLLSGGSLGRVFLTKSILTDKIAKTKYKQHRVKPRSEYMFSPELLARISYKLNSRTAIILSSILKLRSFGRNKNRYLGVGVGVSYKVS